MGVSTDALQRYIREENMPPFDAAVRLCKAAGVRLEWLASGEGEMRVGADARGAGTASTLSRDSLVAAIALADETLAPRRHALTSQKYADLLALTYELLEAGVPSTKVPHFILVAAG